jgi:hypothetical protein
MKGKEERGREKDFAIEASGTLSEELLLINRCK